MNRSLAGLLIVMFAGNALAQADAPRLSLLQLDRQLGAQLDALDERDRKARLLKGAGITGFVVGGVSLTGFAALTLLSISGGIFKSTTNSLAATFAGGQYAPRATPQPDYTAVLGVAVVSLAVGLVTTIAGAALGASDDERLALEFQRGKAAAATDSEYPVLEAPPGQNEPEPAPAAPTEPARNPLRPPQRS